MPMALTQRILQTSTRSPLQSSPMPFDYVDTGGSELLQINPRPELLQYRDECLVAAGG